VVFRGSRSGAVDAVRGEPLLPMTTVRLWRISAGAAWRRHSGAGRKPALHCTECPPDPGFRRDDEREQGFASAARRDTDDHKGRPCAVSAVHACPAANGFRRGRPCTCPVLARHKADDHKGRPYAVISVHACPAGNGCRRGRPCACPALARHNAGDHKSRPYAARDVTAHPRIRSPIRSPRDRRSAAREPCVLREREWHVLRLDSNATRRISSRFNGSINRGIGAEISDSVLDVTRGLDPGSIRGRAPEPSISSFPKHYTSGASFPMHYTDAQSW
jgi:hypothetical protein